MLFYWLAELKSIFFPQQYCKLVYRIGNIDCVRNGLDMSGTAMRIALAELQNCCKLMTWTRHSGAPVHARLLYCSRCYTMTTQLWGSKHSSMIYYHTTTVGTVHTRSTTWSSVLRGTQKLIQNKIQYWIQVLFRALSKIAVFPPKRVSSKLGKRLPSPSPQHVTRVNTSPHTADNTQPTVPDTTHPTTFTKRLMETVLQIASRVEAAMEAYNSIQDVADKQEWKVKFKEELVSVHLHSVWSFYI